MAVRATVNHSFAYRIRATADHPYRSASTIRVLAAHPYAGRAVARNETAHPYSHAATLRSLSSHPYITAAFARNTASHPYGMIVATARGLAHHLYAISDIERVRALTAHLYSHAEALGAVAVYTESVVVAGAIIDPLSIDLSWSRSEYTMSATIEVADAADYLQFTRGASVVVNLFGDTYTMVVESKSRRRAYGAAWTYAINCLSPSSLLDAPYADTINGELTGMASALATILAGSLPISWQTVDWLLPPATWIAADQTPLELLRTLAAAAGAILVRLPDGSLMVEPAYPVAVPRWHEGTPELVIDEVLDVYEASEDDDHRPGYNVYLVSDQMASSETLRIEDEAVDDTLHRLRVYQTPWVDNFDMRHTGGDWVFLESLGIKTMQKTETVEIVRGEGRAQYPIYGVVSVSWSQVNLGTITTSEDGMITASIDGESLLEITYTTKSRMWAARSSSIEDVQFVAEEIVA